MNTDLTLIGILLGWSVGQWLAYWWDGYQDRRRERRLRKAFEQVMGAPPKSTKGHIDPDDYENFIELQHLARPRENA